MQASKSDKLSCWLYWGVVVLLLAFRLGLTLHQGLVAIDNAPHDDTLFLRLAAHICQFEWLGPYNQLTLIKRPVYPLFIAAVHAVGLPLLFAQHLAYALACLLLVQALAPLVAGRVQRLSLFTLILFMPMLFAAYPCARVLRAMLSTALTLLVLGCCLGLLISCRQRRRSVWWWSIGTGIFLSAFWLCREESIWLLPGLVVLYAGFLVYGYKKPGALKAGRIPLVLPWLMLLASYHGLCLLNYAYYGVYTTCEMHGGAFQAAYGALTRVKPDHWHPRVPVPKDVRLRVYPVSPAFAELAAYLEGEPGRKWAMFATTSNDIEGGHFMWALRGAAARQGYHASARQAGAFYQRLAREVNSACDQGLLHCLAERATLVPPRRPDYLPLFWSALGRGVKALVCLERFQLNSPPSQCKAGSRVWIQAMTAEKLNPTKKQPGWEEILTRSGPAKCILNGIYQVYCRAMPVLLLLGVLGFLVSCFRLPRGKGVLLCLFQAALLAALISRVVLLALVHISSFQALKPNYLCPAYPLAALFAGLGILILGSALWRFVAKAGGQRAARSAAGDTR